MSMPEGWPTKEMIEAALDVGMQRRDHATGAVVFNFNTVSLMIEAALSAPTPPVYQFKVIRSMIYWADCSKREYEGHSKYPDDYATRKLYTSPPSPKAKWDAEGNPLNLEAAAEEACKFLEGYCVALETLGKSELPIHEGNLKKITTDLRKSIKDEL